MMPPEAVLLPEEPHTSPHNVLGCKHFDILTVIPGRDTRDTRQTRETQGKGAEGRAIKIGLKKFTSKNFQFSFYEL